MPSDNRRSTALSADPASGKSSKSVKQVILTLIVVALIGVLGAAGVMFSGTFNVAATVADSPALMWILVTVRENSIKFHARDIQAPPLADAARLANGFKVYRNDCVMCHTRVGRQPTAMALGLNPQAPSFEENDMTAAELYWVAKNGIRFTGMPAWGASRSDQDLWDAVGFLMTLPKMSGADYDALDRRTPGAQPLDAQGSDAGSGSAQKTSASSPAQ